MINFFKKLDFVALRRMAVLGLIITGFSLLPRESRAKLSYAIINNSKSNIVLKNTITGEVNVLEPGAFTIDLDTKETSFDYIKYDLYKNKNICSCYGDSFSIVVLDTTLKITKKINNKSNWEYIEEENVLDKGGEFTCRFVIDDNDIKK